MVYLQIARSGELPYMLFGTGASEKGGVKEGAYTVQYLFNNFERLSEFAVFSEFHQWPLITLGDSSLVDLRALCRETIAAETFSQNTFEEVRIAASKFLADRREHMIIISSPTHLPRCLRDAYAALSEDTRCLTLRNNLFATPSDTSYAGADVRDVVIIEPPHRQDRDMLPLHTVSKRIFNIPRDHKATFLQEFEGLLAKFGA